MEQNYSDRNILSLDELIEVRTKKVDDLIANIPNVEATGFRDQLKKHMERVDEYASVVTYLRELRDMKANGGAK